MAPKSAMKYIPLPASIPAPSSSTEKLVTAKGDEGYPCRRCQSNAVAGETLRLISYYPFEVPESKSPYLGKGPIFVHENDCIEYEGSSLPEAHLPRIFSLRAYSGEHMLLDSDISQGREVDAKVEQMLSREDVKFVHAHHAKQGCFAFKVVSDL